MLDEKKEQNYRNITAASMRRQGEHQLTLRRVSLEAGLLNLIDLDDLILKKFVAIIDVVRTSVPTSVEYKIPALFEQLALGVAVVRVASRWLPQLVKSRERADEYS